VTIFAELAREGYIDEDLYKEIKKLFKEFRNYDNTEAVQKITEILEGIAEEMPEDYKTAKGLNELIKYYNSQVDDSAERLAVEWYEYKGYLITYDKDVKRWRDEQGKFHIDPYKELYGWREQTGEYRM